MTTLLTLSSLLLAGALAPARAADKMGAGEELAFQSAGTPLGALKAEPLSFRLIGSPSGASAPMLTPLLPSFSGPSASSLSSPGLSMGFGNSQERQDLDKISALNQIDQQKVVAKLRALNEEREEAAARYNLLYEKQKLELAPFEAELKRLQLAASLADERFKKEYAALREQRDKARAENELAREQLEAHRIKAEAEKQRMDVVIQGLDFESRKLRQESELAEHKTVGVKADLELRVKTEEWRKEANREPVYLSEPFSEGVLTISDRRIPLNGPIVYGMADFVADRISYFNNKSQSQPIFIVIDRSPGGSVLEGSRILKAIQESKAPIHVVVKSFAASMAAAIATLAPRSYAYPNAVILHHQIFSFTIGNPTQQKQQLEMIDEWNRRLLTPVARKMGLSLDGLTKKMYERSVDGDWEEFADRAVSLKWIDRVVQEVRETGVVKQPEDKSAARPTLLLGLAEETDPRGERFVRLPRLQPFDSYFLFNKDSYYR